MDAVLFREIRFNATHRYALRGRTLEESREVFGAQSEPHDHDWTVRLEVQGPIDAVTGFCVDLGVLDQALAAVVGDWDGGDLNERVPEIGQGRMQPSTEELARWIFDRIRPRVPAPASLRRVHVWESPELGACYPA